MNPHHVPTTFGRLDLKIQQLLCCTCRQFLVVHGGLTHLQWEAPNKAAHVNLKHDRGQVEKIDLYEVL